MVDPAARDRSLGIDRVLHEPARLTIVSQLYVVESADFVFVMHQTGLTQGNLSSHLAKLESAGYVAVQKEFVERRPRTLLQLTEEGRAAFDEYVARLQRVVERLAAREPVVLVAAPAGGQTH